MPSIVTVAEGVVLAVINELRGKSDDITAKNIATAVAEKAEEAAAAAIKIELEKYEAALGLILAEYDLAGAVQRAFEGIRAAASKPSMTDELLDGADVQEMPPGSKLDANGDWSTPEELPHVDSTPPLELVDINTDAEPTKP